MADIVWDSDEDLDELSEEELFDLADETEEAIHGIEELQQELLNYHERICYAVLRIKAKDRGINAGS